MTEPQEQTPQVEDVASSVQPVVAEAEAPAANDKVVTEPTEKPIDPESKAEAEATDKPADQEEQGETAQEKTDDSDKKVDAAVADSNVDEAQPSEDKALVNEEKEVEENGKVAAEEDSSKVVETNGAEVGESNAAEEQPAAGDETNGVHKRKAENGAEVVADDEKSPKKAKVVDEAEQAKVEETAAWIITINLHQQYYQLVTSVNRADISCYFGGNFSHNKKPIHLQRIHKYPYKNKEL